jgi:hypothetical protein
MGAGLEGTPKLTAAAASEAAAAAVATAVGGAGRDARPPAPPCVEAAQLLLATTQVKHDDVKPGAQPPACVPA